MYFVIAKGEQIMSGGNKNIAERIIDFINSFSYEEKENRRLISYEEKIVRYNI